MSWLAVRIALGGGRGEAVRALLVVLGAAFATSLLLAAAVVSAIHSSSGDAYRSSLLNEAGLRPGVTVALTLMVVPVLVFLGMCARVAAAQRERRLAALALAGGTPAQVRTLAALDTAVPAALGAVLGLTVLVVVKGLLEQRYLSDPFSGASVAFFGSRPPRSLPTDIPLPLIRSLAVLLLVPALAAASAVVALRQVVTTPLGIVRRHRPAPRAVGLPLLVVGLLLVGVPSLLLGGVSAIPLYLGALALLVGLALSGSWLAALAGRSVAGRTRLPALMLAGRRLQDDPRAQGRALSGVVLAVFVAACAAVLRSVTLAMSGDDAFYRSAYDLVDLALAVSLLVAAAGLVVAATEGVLERRRTLAALHATGVPRATLQRAVLLQALLPAVPAVLLAAVTGTVTGALLVAGSSVPALRVLVVVGIALLAVAAAAAITLPLVSRATRISELRTA